MNSESEISGPEMVLELLGQIWKPTAEAMRVQNALNVHSLNETSAAALRAGYEISYVDLPPRVSGFATEIEGKPHIVVNRAKSDEHQQYTLFHELGHQVLHVNPSGNSLKLPIRGMEEFQAHMFAFVWIMRIASAKERESVLRQNPESSAFMSLAVLMTGCIVASALLFYLLSRLFLTKPSSALIEK